SGSGCIPVRKTYQPLPLSVAAQQRVERVAHSLHVQKASLQTMAAAVAAVSHVYTRERGQMGALHKHALLARAGFFWPRDLVKVFGPLDELTRWLPARWDPTTVGASLRVLDVGAGLGATSFGLARWLRARGLPVDKLEIVALEHDASALRGFSAFAKALADLPDELVPVELEARAEDLRMAPLGEQFDLVLFGFVLNELFVELPLEQRIARRAELLQRACARLSPGGALIVLEPALKATTRELMQLRDLLALSGQAPYVIAPCLHARPCPMLPSERDWCHQELPYALPGQLAEIAKAASLRYEGLSYASLVLANQPRSGALMGPAEEPLYRIVSDRLASKGKLELIGCGPTYQRFTRLDRHHSPQNQAFGEAQRGALLELESAAPRIDAQTHVRAR
ncbi:MAG: hypothetical protein JWN48_5831, partial [Myxococcaceae bacterium]|nr:hypothetical protein [Myxococcaceae bacterium]